MQKDLRFEEMAIYAMDILREINMLDTFTGIDVSQEESLLEYGFIHSEAMGLALYRNEYGMLDAIYSSAKDLRKYFIDQIECIDELSIGKFLVFCCMESILEYKEYPLSVLVDDFCGYFGVANSPLASSAWCSGYNNKEDVKKLLSYYFCNM